MDLKSDLHPIGSADPNHVGVDTTVNKLNSERYWLCAAVDPDEILLSGALVEEHDLLEVKIKSCFHFFDQFRQLIYIYF